jgi:predicted TIM-barrel fold metal-dependent hydrolase
VARPAIVDVHAHLWRTVINGSRYFSDKALEKWAANFGLGATVQVDLDGEMLVHALDVAQDALGAEYRICVFAIDLRPLFRMEIELSELNGWVIREAGRDHHGRILPFACLNPIYPGTVEEVRAAALRGARGFKLYPPTGFYPDDPKAYPVYEAVIEAQKEVGRTLPVLFHTGFSYSGSRYARPVHLEEVAFRFQPDLRLIAAHAGIPWTDEALWVAAVQRNVYLDIALFGDVVGFWPELHAELLAKAKRAGVLDRILFGSDWPLCALWLNEGATPAWANLQNIVRAVEQIETPVHLLAAGYPELRDDDLAGLLGRNAAALFDGGGLG